MPTKRKEDAGYDLYTTDEPTILKPHETRLFGTGLVSMFSDDLVGIVKERGSTGTHGIAVRSGVIDSGYRGEWKVALTNENDFPIEFSADVEKVQEIKGKLCGRTKRLIYPLSKAIAQVVFLQLASCESGLLTDEDLKEDTSERGEGGWGASGK